MTLGKFPAICEDYSISFIKKELVRLAFSLLVEKVAISFS